MLRNARFLIALIVFISAAYVFADDQEKATKEIKKISAISVDSNMRSVVNRTFADALKVGRLDLVRQRKDMTVNYGDLFLLTQLGSGVKVDDITEQLKAGKSLIDIANGDHINWKQVSVEAKKLNKKIDDNIVKYFADTKKQASRDQADGYDAKADKVPADSNLSKEDYAEAQARYSHLLQLSGQQLPTGDANVRNQGQGESTPTVGQPRSGPR